MTSPENRPHGDGASPSADTESAALELLDEPIDHRGISELLHRRGVARSTRRLLVVLAVVLVFAAGALVGRLTAPAPRGPQDPPLAGAVESVDPVEGGAVLTLRAADGTLTAVRTSAGTRIATVRAGDPTTVGAGIAVEVAVVQGDDGSLTATRVDVVPG